MSAGHAPSSGPVPSTPTFDVAALWMSDRKCVIGERLLKRDETLFHRGDAVRAIYFLRSGSINLVRHFDDGRAITMGTARDGQLLAEAALFADSYHCDAIAAEPSAVLTLDRGSLLERLAGSADFALDYIAFQAHQIRRLRALLEIANLRPATRRVLQYLELEAHDGCIVLRRSLKSMASEIGLSHEAFYRVLAQLEREGAIERSSDSIRLRG